MPSKWNGLRTILSPDGLDATRRGTTMASLALRLYQKTDPKADFAVLLENKKTKNSLLFQAGTVATLSQPETDAIRGDYYGRLLDAYACLGVLQVCPRENTQLYLVVVTKCVKVCNFQSSSVYKIQEIDILSLHAMRPQNYKSQVGCKKWRALVARTRKYEMIECAVQKWSNAYSFVYTFYTFYLSNEDWERTGLKMGINIKRL
ncbi:synaptojanin-1-like [Penaeus indicus]|uniref:synaptojanin-1-like n=1 Tax=Penaeus indicus TaxID=29960 RepID=UPI00300C67F7